jgi:hypothetical protein
VKLRLLTLLLLAFPLAMTAGCKKETPKAPEPTTVLQQQPQPTGPVKCGKVVESVNGDGYTFVQLDTGTEKLWAAAAEFPVRVGETVTVPEGTPMTNYHCKPLNRDFETVLFVDSITVGSPAQAAAPALK